MKKRIKDQSAEMEKKPMTKKKKITLISLIAAAVVLIAVLVLLLIPRTTLVKLEDGTYDRGAVINMYLTDEAFDFDPQKPITDDAQLKVTRMLFEGLTTLKDNGKWEAALMDSYTETENDRDGYSITIDIKETKWTDGRTVQACDFVYSWKRLVDPNFRGEAASLLYDIKNAKDINLGDVSIDDLGVSAVDTYTLKVTFEDKHIDLDRFFTNLSSIALVPLREDVITRHGDNWAKVPTAITTNGPFALKVLEDDGEVRLERSSYYLRNTEDNDYLDKYVIPYRLVTKHGTELGDVTKAIENDQLFYVDLAGIPAQDRSKYQSEAEVADLMMTHTYFFNTNSDLFKDADVRRALSLALDRNEIAKQLVFAKAAEGVVPAGVFNTTYKTSFREEGGALIKASANLAEAEKLLEGAKKGTINILMRDNETDKAIAEYVKGVWEKLGYTVKFTVSSNKTGKYIDSATSVEFSYVAESYTELYASGKFDVVAVDMNAASPDAFGILAQFAEDFSGNGVDMLDKSYPVYPHVTGYDNEAYTALIKKAYEAKSEEDRAKALHEAEKLLINDMPICPIVTLQSAYIKSDLLSGFDTDYYGVTDFKRVKMKNYMDYKEEESEETAPSAE